MKAFILLIILSVFSGIAYKGFHEFDDKVSPSFMSRCQGWGGKSSVVERFRIECIKGKIHNTEIEKEYRYTFYGVAGFVSLLIIIFLFSFQGNKNDE